jgi:hypothetical protein
MANHTTGAQRYNARMDKIFARSEELGNHTLHGSTEKSSAFKSGKTSGNYGSHADMDKAEAGYRAKAKSDAIKRSKKK